MKKMSGVVLVAVALVTFVTTAVAGTKEDIENIDLVGVEALLSSIILECKLKKDVSQYASVSAKQELFRRLVGVDNQQNKNVFVQAKRKVVLMNEVFVYEDIHEWDEVDNRDLNLVWSTWTKFLDPDCFDDKEDGLASEEWLRGASWAMRQKQ